MADINGGKTIVSVPPEHTVQSSALSRDDKVSRLFIVRHAEHVSESIGTLSRKGSLQARAIAKTLKQQGTYLAVYSSTRCKETAEIIANALHIPLIFDDRLQNWNSGVLTGLSLEDIKEKYPDIYQKRYKQRIPDYKVPEGESLKERYERVKDIMNEVASKSVGKNVVLVTHGGVIDDMYRIACEFPLPKLTGLLKPYGCLSVLAKLPDDTWRDEQWAGVNHLPQVVAESPTGGHLYLFPYQVAGSNPMFRGDRGELCKPASQKELECYERIGKVYPQMEAFVPVYLGTVDIDVKHIIQDMHSLSRPLHQIPERLTRQPLTPGASPVTTNESMPEPSSLHLPANVISPPKDGTGREDKTERSLLESSLTPPSVQRFSDSPAGLHGTTTPPTASLSSQGPSLEPKREEQTASATRMKPQSPPKHSTCISARRPSSNQALEGHTKHSRSLLSRESLVPDGKVPFSVSNLWTRFAEGRWKKVVKSKEGNGRYVYLVLENLSHGLVQPHILDLKVGTQQHGPEESLAKRTRKEARCRSTTSATLGIRLAGMQRYLAKEGRYLLKDKYWGRSLDEEALECALCDFVMNDGKVRVSVVKEIILQLKGLLAVVKQTQWRFYGSSILILFDGNAGEQAVIPRDSTAAASPGNAIAEAISRKRGRARTWSEDPGCDKVSVRLIDFSHCDYDETRYQTHDEGLVFGLENLLRIYTELMSSH